MVATYQRMEQNVVLEIGRRRAGLVAGRPTTEGRRAMGDLEPAGNWRRRAPRHRAAGSGATSYADSRPTRVHAPGSGGGGSSRVPLAAEDEGRRVEQVRVREARQALERRGGAGFLRRGSPGARRAAAPMGRLPGRRAWRPTAAAGGGEGRSGAAPVAGEATTHGGTAPAAGACSRGWGGGNPRRGRAPAAGEAANGAAGAGSRRPAAASRGSGGARRR